MGATRRKKMRGGALVGQGSFGCVFKPNLLCEGETKVSDKLISKYITDDYSRVEMIVRPILSQIDLHQDYFIYPIRECKPSRRYKKAFRLPTNNIAKCEVDINDEDARILQYTYGGESLYTLVVQPSQYVDFFTNLGRLLEGLSLLHTNPVEPMYHLDIKSDNIVCDEHMVCRYIDFGLAETKSRATDSAFYTDYTSSVYPFDTRFVKGYTFDGKDFSQRSYDVNHKFLDTFHLDRYYFPAEMVNPDESSDRFQQKYKIANLLDLEMSIEERLKERFINNSEERSHFLYTAADVFSLGKVLSRLYGRHMGQFLEYSFDHGTGELFLLNIDGNKQPYSDGRYEKHGIYNTFTAPQKAWFDEIYKTISLPFYQLILKMLHLDPFKRITAEKAVEQYRKIIPNIQRMLQEKYILRFMKFMAPHLPYGSVRLPNVAGRPPSRIRSAITMKKINKQMRSV